MVPGAFWFAGLVRYAQFRLALRYEDRVYRRRPGGLPPPRLRFRVHGALDVASYEAMGAVIASTLSDVLARHAVSLTDRKVLDFGCGPARVASRFKLRYPSCMLFGTDVDAEAIEWARAHVPEAGSFGINGQLPPLSFDDGFFDVVYSVSVFTHLDESSQRLWLRELSRVVKPGGIVMATVHGDAAQASCTEGEISQLQEHGFAFRIGHKGRWKLDGLPDFYQTSFQTREHVKRTWTQWFQLVEHAEGALHGHQDLVVLRRPHR